MLSGLRRAVRIEIDVIGHKQVEFAVAIVVNPGTAGPPMGSIPADTGLPGDVGEGSITVVVVKHILTPIGDKRVLKPVVVIVAHANTGRPTGTEQAGFCGHIGQGAISIVLVQPVRGAWRSGLEAWPAEDEDVEPAVIIVIEQGASTAHRFHDVVLSENTAIDGGRM
jgi:hypothetical protein